MIVAFIQEDYREWDAHLSDFCFAYNTAFHSSLSTSPAFLNLGRELIPSNSLRYRGEDDTVLEPGDTVDWSHRMTKLQSLREWVLENLEMANQKQARYYNLRQGSVRFKVGDLVLRRSHVLSFAAQHIAAKLASKFQGPFRVGRVLSSVVYEWTNSPQPNHPNGPVWMVRLWGRFTSKI